MDVTLQHVSDQPMRVGAAEEVAWTALEILSRVLALDDNCRSTLAARLCQLSTNQRLLCALRWQQDSASLQVERAAFFLPTPDSPTTPSSSPSLAPTAAQPAAFHSATAAAAAGAEAASLLVAGAADVVQQDAADSLSVRVCGVELPVRPHVAAGL